MQQPIRLMPSIIILLIITGCTMGGVRHVPVIDEDKQDIKQIVVFPLYSSSFGIGIGPDGNGPWSSPRVFAKPFLFSSGEDIISKQIQGRGFIIPSLIFIGTRKYVERWLFIKKDLHLCLYQNQIFIKMRLLSWHYQKTEPEKNV